MKKAGLLLGITFVGLMLLGCNNHFGLQEIPQVQASDLKPMPQSWYGVLPCADCAGIETSLYLDKSGDWRMRQHYRGTHDSATFTSRGSWARTADKLVLTEDSGEQIYFRVKNNSLEMTDSEGNTSASGLSYTLRPTQKQKNPK